MELCNNDTISDLRERVPLDFVRDRSEITIALETSAFRSDANSVTILIRLALKSAYFVANQQFST